jgi:hypothetical protein
MTWTDTVGNLLKQITSTGAVAKPDPDVDEDFEQVAHAAPTPTIAAGLTAAFKSKKTPAFGEMLSRLYSNSDCDQKAGIINQLFGLMGAGNTHLTAEQAQNLSPEAVRRLATHVQNSNPSVVESVSAFYAQHITLIKSLGGVALTVALAKIVEEQRHAWS